MEVIPSQQELQVTKARKKAKSDSEFNPAALCYLVNTLYPKPNA